MGVGKKSLSLQTRNGLTKSIDNKFLNLHPFRYFFEQKNHQNRKFWNDFSDDTHKKNFVILNCEIPADCRGRKNTGMFVKNLRMECHASGVVA